MPREAGYAVLRVAAEQFVRGLPAERDGDVLAGEPGEQQEPEEGKVDDRLLEVPQPRVEQSGQLPGAREQLVGGRSERGGDEPRVAELVRVPVLREADGEGLHRA